MNYQLVDFETQEKVSASNFVFTGEDNRPWEVLVDLDAVRSRLNPEYFKKEPPFVSKYLPFMPVSNYSNFISLQEGSTPLIKSKAIGKRLNLDLYFKVEGKNPTGSFKDRGSAVELSIAKELGVPGISVASTGNMAASCSCYAAAAGIPCFLFVPEDTPPSKLAQAISYGGRIVQVKGTYDDAARLAKQVAEDFGFYLAGDYAFRVEGQKTAAFELVDQMFYRVPDLVLIPIGCGTNLTAYAKGFKEYKELGFIRRLPRLFGIQAEGASSVVNSFEQGKRTIETLPRVDTIASAIAVRHPLDGIKALHGIYSTNGGAIAVSDKEMLEAQYMLSRDEGLFVESSSAATIAALIKADRLCAEGKGESLHGQTVVCVLTGDGLKDPSPLLRAAIKPPTIYPEVSEFRSLFESTFFEGKTFSFVDRSEVIISTPPSDEDLSKLIRSHLGTSYSQTHVTEIRKAVERVLKKGKPVTFSDFQDIVQDVFESATRKSEPFLLVEDFRIETALDKRSKAEVSVIVHGETKSAKSEGVGPVDAVINALQTACSGAISFSLEGYRVNIRSEGTDALVYVELKLVQDSRVSLGKGASPDIIQASIEAFVEAYNAFHTARE